MRSTDSWSKRRSYSSEISSSSRRASSLGGARIQSSFDRSRWIAPAESRHWPAASRTVSPSGKRGVTVSARKAAHCSSLTSLPSLVLRPRKSWYSA